MPEQPPLGSQPPAQVQTSLHELAALLRDARHLEPETQQALADLVDELSNVVDPTALPSAETAHLVASAADLARALHHRHEPGLLSTAKERLENAVRRAEAEAPLATGVARRLIDTLANLGI